MSTKNGSFVGTRVRVNRCDAKKHGDFHDECVCRFIGVTVSISGQRRVMFGETPEYFVNGTTHHLKQDQVTDRENRLVFSTLD